MIYLLIFIILKLIYIGEYSGYLSFFLHPVSTLTSIYTGADYSIIDGAYHFYGLNIVINKSCSGFNFFLTLFLMFGLQFKVVNFGKIGIIKPALFLFIAYIQTLVINSFRIISWISLKLPTESFGFNLHLVQGVFVYLFFIVLIYLINRFIIRRVHEKSN